MTESLKSLFPSADTALIQFMLDSNDGNVEHTAEELLHQLPSQHQEPNNVSTLPEGYIMDMAKEAVVTNMMNAGVYDSIPNTRTPAFTSVRNGDCAPHAMGLALAFIVDKLPKAEAEHEYLATQVRQTIIDFLTINWTKESLLSQSVWHELVYFAHNVAITEEEREIYGDWGESASSRMEGWMKERDSLFFTTSEFLAFCEIMRQINIPIVFRLWKQKRGKLVKVDHIPTNVVEGLVFDMKHTGKSDSSNAHWQLLKSGSASVSSALNSGSVSSKKRKYNFPKS
jgi:hypothetical protein